MLTSPRRTSSRGMSEDEEAVLYGGSSADEEGECELVSTTDILEGRLIRGVQM